MRTKGSKKDPSVDGLNKFKPYKSNDLFQSDVGSLEYLEKIGAVQTNITGANPFGDKRI